MQGPVCLAFALSASLPALAARYALAVERVALKPASSVRLIQVHGGGLEQMGNYFSTADRSIRNPAFPIPQARGVSALRDSLWLPQYLCCAASPVQRTGCCGCMPVPVGKGAEGRVSDRPAEVWRHLAPGCYPVVY